MQNFEPDKNSTKTLAGPDSDILQKFSQVPGDRQVQNIRLSKSLSTRQVQGKL